MKLPRPSGIQTQPLRNGNSECVRPAHLERSSTVRLPDYLRWHGGGATGDTTGQAGSDRLRPVTSRRLHQRRAADAG